MRSRGLLILGIGAIAASLLLAVSGIGVGRTGAWSMGASSGVMGRAFSGGSSDIGLDRAVTIAQGVAASYPSGGLAADEVIAFSGNYYASIRETATGIGAFEILIDRSSGTVIREPGPDMIWNAKYSMMGGGMTGGFGVGGSRPMTVSTQQAQDVAQRWLDTNQTGTSAKAPDSFYGFYTVDFQRAGRLVGMLSVNGYSGQVWFHSWHGSFIQLRDLGAGSAP
jgi:hypothetical protein